MEDFESTIVNIPVTQDQLERDAFLHDEKRKLSAGDRLIRNDQPVEKLYLLISGRIDVIRHLGTPRESEPQTFSYVPGVDKWHPILGGRYLFTKRLSSQDYVAKTTCLVQEITHETLRGKLYLSGRCIAIVRELLRCSDMPMDCFLRTELDKRFNLFGFPGFDIQNPEHLLTVDADRDAVHYSDPDPSAIDRVKSGLALMDKEYVEYGREMVRRLLGEEVDASRNGETRIGFDAPPLRR